MNISFNKEIVLKIINNEECLKESVLLLESLMDEELEKDENEIDFAFLNECSDVLIELQSGERADVKKVVPFLNSKEFLTRAGKSRRRGRIIKILMVAAIITTSTLTANAAVGTITGQSIFDRVSSGFSDYNYQDVSDATVIHKAVNTSLYVEKIIPDTKKVSALSKADEPAESIVITEKDNGNKIVFKDAERTKINYTSKKNTQEKAKTTDTSRKPDKTTEITTASPVLYKINVVIAHGSFKKYYQIGERFDSSGLFVIGYYSDGTAKTLEYGDYSVIGFDSKTAGVKNIRIIAGKAVYTLSVIVEDKNTTTEDNEPSSQQTENAD